MITNCDPVFTILIPPTLSCFNYISLKDREIFHNLGAFGINAYVPIVSYFRLHMFDRLLIVHPAFLLDGPEDLIA